MDFTLFLFAAFGGIAIQLLNLAEAHKLSPDERPNFKDPLYWVAYLVAAAVAVFVAWAYVASGFELKGFLAIHIGASSPLLLRTMASLLPQTINTQVGA